MAALLRHGARKVGGSVVQRTRAAFTTPAAAVERRLLTTEHHSIDSPVVKALLKDTKVLTEKEFNTIREAELNRLEEMGLLLRPKVQPIQAATGVKGWRYSLPDQGTAYVIILVFVVGPLVLRAMTK